jgi:hypothetical protein
MDSEPRVDGAGVTPDFLDDFDEIVSFEDGTLPAERYLDRELSCSSARTSSRSSPATSTSSSWSASPA